MLLAGTVPWLLGLLVVVVGMVVVEVVVVVLSVEMVVEVVVLLIVAGSHSILSINLPQYKENFHLKLSSSNASENVNINVIRS